MAQLDALIIFPIIWSLLLVLLLHYNVSVKKLIPLFIGVKKFRYKKLNLFFIYKHNLKIYNTYITV